MAAQVASFMADESQGYCLNEHFHDEVKKDERTQNLYTENEKQRHIKYQNIQGILLTYNH